MAWQALTEPHCPFPNCTLADCHDGDHDFARPPRPRGKLRCVQEFARKNSTPPCDLHDAPPPVHALGFFLDELGFGWALCYGCVQEFGAVEEMAGAEHEALARDPQAIREALTDTPGVKCRAVEFNIACEKKVRVSNKSGFCSAHFYLSSKPKAGA